MVTRTAVQEEQQKRKGRRGAAEEEGWKIELTYWDHGVAAVCVAQHASAGVHLKHGLAAVEEGGLATPCMQHCHLSGSQTRFEIG